MFSNICYEISRSAKNYYEYLTEHDKSLKKTEILSATKIDDYTCEIFTRDKITNFDCIDSIECNNTRIPLEKYKTISIRSRAVILSSSPSYISKIIESDKRYLVDNYRKCVLNIKKKFENVTTINLPRKNSCIIFNKKDFPDVHFTAVQLNAIKNIFSSPLSYVWGGAGSGKTKYVLSYSVLNYLLSEKKILLTAPTHIALENALTSIIEIAKRYGVSTSKILRLGFPSQEFADKYPECCENTLFKKIQDDLIKKRQNLVDCLHRMKWLDKFKFIKGELQQYNELDIIYDKLIRERDELYILSQLQSNQIEIMFDGLKFKEKELAHLNNKSNRLYNKLFYSEKLKEQKSNLVAELDAARTQYEDCKHSLSKIEDKLKTLSNEIEQLSLDKQLLSKSIADNLFSGIRELFDVSDFTILSDQISEYETRYKEFIDCFKRDYNDVDFSSAELLFNSIENLSKEISRNFDENKKHNNEILLYACTLDKLASVDELPPLSHVFLDEACYSPIAKVAQLYFLNCPVTFLGDHMQLPPVCEINEDILLASRTENLCLWAQSGIYSPNLFDRSIQTINKDYLCNSKLLPSCLSLSELNQTHRFGKSVADVLDLFVYKNNFESVSSGNTTIRYMHATKDKNSKSRISPEEINVIKKYITQNKLTNFAILTPYKDQVKALREAIPADECNEILTIHKSQGQEWDIVFLSVVDTKDCFFTDISNQVSRGKEVLNTAISRAKKELIIVCDADYWKQLDGQLISALINVGEEIIT